MAAIALAACAGTPPSASLSHIGAERTAAGVALAEGGRPLLFYQQLPLPGREAWRLHYLHPLHAPDGTVLTEDAPADHPHQRGLYWAWRRILVNGVQVADGWVGNGLTLVTGEPKVVEQGDGSVKLETAATWWVPLDGRNAPIVEEHSTIHARRLPDGARRLELLIRLRALRPGVALAGTDDDKGYGGPSVRLRDGASLELAGDGRALVATQARLSAGTTIDFQWRAGTPLAGRRVTLACRVDGWPWTEWVLRQEASMQNCAFPGRRPHPVPERGALHVELDVTLR